MEISVWEVSLWLAAAAVSIFAARGFFKAGRFKATASKETMLGAGFGWIEKLPLGIVRLIAWLEILGAAGLILAPIGYLLGQSWAIWFAVAAGIGLALTMVGAILVHAARGETKYTLKMNLGLLGFSALAAGLWVSIPLTSF